MSSTFAWLDHSENERRKALDIVDLFRDQDTRDELGIGTVRDALADALFPGINTIQTRAKYLLFIPWIYKALEESRTKSRDIARRARKHEIALIYELLESKDTNGVIGKDAKASLQRLPSAIYWSGLQVFGIRRYPGSQSQYHRSLDGFYRGRSQAHASAEDGIVELFKLQANWHDGIPLADEEFPLGVTLELENKEAEYLRQQIMAYVPGTFLKSSLGVVQERVLLYWLLNEIWTFSGTAPMNVFQGKVRTDKFRRWIKIFPNKHRITPELKKLFRRRLRTFSREARANGEDGIRKHFKWLCTEFRRSDSHISRQARQERAALKKPIRTGAASSNTVLTVACSRCWTSIFMCSRTPRG